MEQAGHQSPVTFSGDETDKDFHFVPSNNTDKTLKYDPKNFSFRLKNRDSVVVEAREGRCSWRQACCNSLYLGLAATVLTILIMLLSTSPHNYRWGSQSISILTEFVFIPLFFHSKLYNLCHILLIHFHAPILCGLLKCPFEQPGIHIYHNHI